MLKQTTFPEFYEYQSGNTMTPDEIRKKVNALVNAMTAAEKFSLLGGQPDPEGTGKIANAGYLAGIPRLGIPEIRMYDGPAGVTSVRETTGLPMALLMSSAWDEELAYAFGEVAGSENAAVSGNCQLGTQVDIIRTPHFSRNKDMKGEDYVLSARLGAAEVRGVQDQGVIACLKHYAAANTTGFMEMINEVVDEQTLHQMYLRPFEEAIEEAGAGSVMDTYSGINGHYATDNHYLNTYVLRDLWNFSGSVMSDWGANHNMTIPAGMDMEMPRPAYNNTMRILRGIQNGTITWEMVDSAARHVVGMMAAAGLLSLVELDEEGRPYEEYGRTKPIRMPWTYDEKVKAGLLVKNAEIALNIARKGIVLAKNENAALPLSTEKKTALIGMGAVAAFCGYSQERSFGRLERMIAPAVHFEQLTGQKPYAVAKAIDIIGSVVEPAYLYQDEDCTLQGVVRCFGITEEDYAVVPAGFFPGGGGLEFNGFSGLLDEYGELVENDLGMMGIGVMPGDSENHIAGTFCCIDEKIEFVCDGKDYKNHENGNAFPTGQRYTWKGYLKAPETGSYKLKLHFIGGEAALVMKIGDAWRELGHSMVREGAHWPWDSLIPTEEGMNIKTAVVELEAGKVYPFYLFAAGEERYKDMQVRFAWVTPTRQKQDYQEALAAAKTADQAVLFINEHDDNAGMIPGDRKHLFLPEDQKKLIRDISAAARENGTKLTIVYQGIGGTETTAFLDAADAVVITYLPGQEGAQALTEILIGKTNPSGKLTMTWPARDEDTPISDTDLHRQLRLNGVHRENRIDVYFSEGMNCGYRWHDSTGVRPGLCFGHGLSYTTFAYDDLAVSKEGENYLVSFSVENTGEVTGDEIAMVFIGEGEVPAGVQMAKKQLATFTRVRDLAPGEKRQVSLEIPWRELCVWNPTAPLVQRSNGTKDKYEPVIGERKVYVAASAEDIRLTGSIRIDV